MPRKSLKQTIDEEYSGDAVAYYNQHHAGVRRTQLKHENQALYNLLSSCGQLSCAGRMLREVIRDEYDNDPLNLYNDKYPGMTRGKLKKANPGFYKILTQDGLVDDIPQGRCVFGDDAWECYKTNYGGFTRGELQRFNPGLYNRLLREGSIKRVPLADLSEVAKLRSPYGLNALAYYQKHYPGVTRGELKKIRPGLYKRLCREGKIRFVRRKKAA